ncbi:MAG: YbhB/YbcL family Raf kinase inhibitor-like protein, partial [Candidatus Dadabacteria bacterium]
MEIKSKAFKDGEYIPRKYTCQGEDISPPLEVSDIPEGTLSLALIMDDPDAPMGVWVHWILWNISPDDSLNIEENTLPTGSIEGINSWGKRGYGGPCPPSGTHRYMFKIYALDTTLNLSPHSRKEDLIAAMEGHILN